MAKRSSLRASDADRDRVAERLREAAAEGRLLAHELEERLASALRASTYGDLDPLVADLPGDPSTVPRRRRSGAIGLARRYPIPAAVIVLIVAVAVISVLAVAAAVVMTGIWLIPVIAFLVLRGTSGRPRRAAATRRG